MFAVRWFFQLFWIGVCAVSMLLQSALLLGAPLPSKWLIGFVGMATVFGYNFAAPRYRRWPAWGFGILSGLCFFKLNFLQQTALVLPGLIWLLYYDRTRPGMGTGLRQYPMLKPVAIALAWAGVTVLLPIPPELWTVAIPLFVGRAAFIFALALAYDLCDQTSDLEHGLHTLVLQLGPRNARRLIYAALLFSGFSAVTYLFLGVYQWLTVLALLLSLAVSGGLVRGITEQLAWRGWRKILIDSLMLLQFLFVWLSLK